MKTEEFYKHIKCLHQEVKRHVKGNNIIERITSLERNKYKYNNIYYDNQTIEEDFLYEGKCNIKLKVQMLECYIKEFEIKHRGNQQYISADYKIYFNELRQRIYVRLYIGKYTTTHTYLLGTEICDTKGIKEEIKNLVYEELMKYIEENNLPVEEIEEVQRFQNIKEKELREHYRKAVLKYGV